MTRLTRILVFAGLLFVIACAMGPQTAEAAELAEGATGLESVEAPPENRAGVIVSPDGFRSQDI